MDEFALINEVVKGLGDQAAGRWIDLGPGDDAALIAQTPGCQHVASIDTLVEGVHFPVGCAPEDIGYRAIMVSMSDLAAMAAVPRFVLVALTLPNADGTWAGRLAQGMSAAAKASDTYLCGGNIAKGELSITVSVHGEVPVGSAVTRSTAQVGDKIFVSGELGGAAACVRGQEFDFTEPMNPRQQRYINPKARFDLQRILRDSAHAAIDVSDSLVADMDHICTASNVRAELDQHAIPLCAGAVLEDALYGGDDYEILCTAAEPLPGLTCIGEVLHGEGVWMNGTRLQAKGFNHFEH